MQPWNTVPCSKENSPTLWHIGHYRMVLAPTFWFLRLLLSLYEQKLYAKQRKLRFLTNTCAQWRSQSLQSHPHNIDVKFSLILVKKNFKRLFHFNLYSQFTTSSIIRAPMKFSSILTWSFEFWHAAILFPPATYVKTLFFPAWIIQIVTGHFLTSCEGVEISLP